MGSATRKHVFFSFTKIFFAPSAVAASSLPHFLWLIFFSYDCSFHVLLYSKGLDDTEQICGINKVIQQL
jgi:hypothetical protein